MAKKLPIESQVNHLLAGIYQKSLFEDPVDTAYREGFAGSDNKESWLNAVEAKDKAEIKENKEENGILPDSMEDWITVIRTKDEATLGEMQEQRAIEDEVDASREERRSKNDGASVMGYS